MIGGKAITAAIAKLLQDSPNVHESSMYNTTCCCHHYEMDANYVPSAFTHVRDISIC
jgi:hypothetical protein